MVKIDGDLKQHAYLTGKRRESHQQRVVRVLRPLMHRHVHKKRA